MIKEKLKLYRELKKSHSEETNLKKKIYEIGKMLLDELDLHRDDVIVTMKKNLFDEYTISNPHFICHISEDELAYFRKHRND